MMEFIFVHEENMGKRECAGSHLRDAFHAAMFLQLLSPGLSNKECVK